MKRQDRASLSSYFFFFLWMHMPNKTNTIMKQQSEIGNLPKFSMIVFQFSLLRSTFYLFLNFCHFLLFSRNFVKLCQTFIGEIWQFHLNMNIEGTFWRNAVTSFMTSWTSKTFWCNNLWCSLHILCQNESISNIPKFSKLPPFWGSSAFLNRML